MLQDCCGCSSQTFISSRPGHLYTYSRKPTRSIPSRIPSTFQPQVCPFPARDPNGACCLPLDILRDSSAAVPVSLDLVLLVCKAEVSHESSRHCIGLNYLQFHDLRVFDRVSAQCVEIKGPTRHPISLQCLNHIVYVDGHLFDSLSNS